MFQCYKQKLANGMKTLTTYKIKIFCGNKIHEFTITYMKRIARKKQTKENQNLKKRMI